ncbi:tetratricopeptide repeat protein [Hymenobacter rubidus]|uniref:tetratricopeptide repeat protein n=1 Tax=Hymenobacter rubidus TaxID=1441626 RepID=UPI0019203B2A|nr:hypothetical protein [Hymenobacter rubidus]
MKRFVSYLMAFALAGGLQCASAQIARSGEINLLPMYGGFKKSRALRLADARFLADSDQRFASRKAAAAHFAEKGWEFFRKDDLSTAIKRFNQAWLLDSTNASAYWGFGVVESSRHHNTDALGYFRQSIRHDPTNHRIFVDMALSLIDRYQTTSQVSDLEDAISLSQLYIANSHDTEAVIDAYERLAVAYFLKHDYVNSWKYVDSATALNPIAVQHWKVLSELQKAASRD